MKLFQYLFHSPGSSSEETDLNARELTQRARHFRETLAAAKRGLGPQDFLWYPYDSLSNFTPLDSLLTGENRSLLKMAGSEAILDLGCADGEVSFFLESLGREVHAVDNPPTNCNHMRGVRALKNALGSSIEIHERDMDSRFDLPAERYGLAIFCGTLYHLKNPFYALEVLARHARYCLLSTRIAQVVPDKSAKLQHLPVAYLLGEQEANSDSTNYWIFSEAGLKRILQRSGWEICGYTSIGKTVDSDPSSAHADERAFCLLKSNVFGERPSHPIAAVGAALAIIPEPAGQESEFLPQFAVLNAASLAKIECAPGSLATVFVDTGLREDFAAGAPPLPGALGGLTLNVGGTLSFDAGADCWEYLTAGSIPAGLLFAGPRRIDFQIPTGIKPGSRVPIQLALPESTVLLSALAVRAAAPGIFSLRQNGCGQAHVLNQDNSQNQPERPAARGSVIQIFATGGGETTPRLASGKAPDPAGNPLVHTENRPTVVIGSIPAEVIFSGMAPGYVGLWQIDAVIPPAVSPGAAVPLTVTADGVASNTVTIAVV